MGPFEKIVGQIRGVFNFRGSFGMPRLGPEPPAPKSMAHPWERRFGIVVNTFRNFCHKKGNNATILVHLSNNSRVRDMPGKML